MPNIAIYGSAPEALNQVSICLDDQPGGVKMGSEIPDIEGNHENRDQSGKPGLNEATALVREVFSESMRRAARLPAVC